MAPTWRDISSRLGGRRSVSLTAYLIGAPFWIFGFLANEAVSYESWSNAMGILLIATAGHLGLGAIFLIAHLTVMRHRSRRPVSLWVAVAVWAIAGATRALILVVGLNLLALDDEVATLQRIVFSALMAIFGFGFTAYALDAIDRFAAARADVLETLLQGEEQLSAHRAAVESMKETLLAQVDQKLKESEEATATALDKLERSLTTESRAVPELDELRTLSDSTWQTVSQELWSSAPTDPPRIRVRELLELYATSRPARLVSIIVAGFFLLVLLYGRVFDPAIGVLLTGIWTASALAVGALANRFFPPLQQRAVPAFLVLVTVFVFSAVPLLLLASSWGYDTEHPWRVVSVHAITVVVALFTSLPSSVASARDRILAGLTRSLDSTTLEKLHVESQLKVLSQKIASRLHGDVRGNFLAAILRLQDHIARGDNRAAAAEIGVLRDVLHATKDVPRAPLDSLAELQKFVDNWTALVDIALDRPLSGIPEEYRDAVHTIVVDAVNNAVRHGKATWIRIGFTQEPGALLVTVLNNGQLQQSSRSGLGTSHLNLYAPDRWSLVRTSNGLTQLLVRLEDTSLPQASLSR